MLICCSMKKLLPLFLLLWALSIPNTRAITVTIVEALSDEDTIVVDVVWGPTIGTISDVDFLGDPGNSHVTVGDFNTQLSVWANPAFEYGLETGLGFASELDRSFANMTVQFNDGISIKEIAAGFGARIVYGNAVPDGGSSFALLAIGFCGLIGAARVRKI